MEEHNETLEAVVHKAKDFGITFNLDKCQFSIEELKCYGYHFTKEGTKLTLDKVKTVKDSMCPETKQAVRNILGMTRYLSKFVPQNKSLTASMRMLTVKEVSQFSFRILLHNFCSCLSFCVSSLM